MSVTILDIMHLPSLQEARIAAGMNGINRSIASVSVLEAAAAKDLDIDLPGHATNYGQEIILTAFVAYRDSVDAQCEAIHALHQEGEAGIIIFYVGSILPSIDPRVIDLNHHDRLAADNAVFIRPYLKKQVIQFTISHMYLGNRL